MLFPLPLLVNPSELALALPTNLPSSGRGVPALATRLSSGYLGPSSSPSSLSTPSHSGISPIRCRSCLSTISCASCRSCRNGVLCREMLPWRSGKGLMRRKAPSWLSFLEEGEGTGLPRPSGVSWSYSVEAGLPIVARISSLSVGLLSAGCVSSRDKGLVRAECLWSPGAGLLTPPPPPPRRSSRDAGRWDEGATGKRSRLEVERRRLELLRTGTTWTCVRGLIGLGLGPSSARIWAFWMAMRSQETRPGFGWPGRGFWVSKEGEFGCGGEYLVAGNISGL